MCRDSELLPTCVTPDECWLATPPVSGFFSSCFFVDNQLASQVRPLSTDVHTPHLPSTPSFAINPCSVEASRGKSRQAQVTGFWSIQPDIAPMISNMQYKTVSYQLTTVCIREAPTVAAAIIRAALAVTSYFSRTIRCRPSRDYAACRENRQDSSIWYTSPQR